MTRLLHAITHRVRRMRRVTAHHEAGHAVAYRVMELEHGQKFSRLKEVGIYRPDEILEDLLGGAYVDAGGDANESHKIDIDGAAYGFTHIHPRHHIGEPKTEANQENMEADAICLLGGIFAQARYQHVWTTGVVLSGGKGDHERFGKLVADFATGDNQMRLREALWGLARTIMRRRDVRLAVTALAEEVAVGWRFDGNEAVAIMNRAAGWA
jgi:hypothetical protein